jgi:uncharacterized protein (TIGR00730 family)
MSRALWQSCIPVLRSLGFLCYLRSVLLFEDALDRQRFLAAAFRAMRRVCVYCGSSNGANPVYAEAARQLGTALAGRGLELVYGGAHRGLMGILADAVLAHGGKVTGVIPQKLVELEIAHRGLTDLRIVPTLHERKAAMMELADAFIALPGGFGTLEEFFEVATWAQLGLHDKPFGLLNIAGYYEHLLTFIDHAVAERFISAPNRLKVMVEADPLRLLGALASCRDENR